MMQVMFMTNVCYHLIISHITVFVLDDQQSSETSCTCSSEIGITVGGLLLAEGLVAVVIAIIAVVWWLKIKRYTDTNNGRGFTILDSQPPHFQQEKETREG